MAAANARRATAPAQAPACAQLATALLMAAASGSMATSREVLRRPKPRGQPAASPQAAQAQLIVTASGRSPAHRMDGSACTAARHREPPL